MNKTEAYEERAKALFTKEPANMKLLVVVDKLLTGFDAPPCTYLYIDKSMQDHGLFQAICRTNRLDGEDKDFGYIVDYKDLFKKVEHAIAVYTSELDRSPGGADPDVLLHHRLEKGKERLDQALEALALLCEPVEPPKAPEAVITSPPLQRHKPSDKAYVEHVRSIVLRETENLTAQSFYPSQPPIIQETRKAQPQRLVLQIKGGVHFALIGVCDQDCGHVALALYDPQKALMMKTPETSNVVIFAGAPPQGGRYELEITVPGCRESSCYTAVGILERR